MYRATVLFLILPLVGFGFAWLATAAYAMFNPTHIIPLFNDPIYQKQMAYKEGILVQVNAKEIFNHRTTQDIDTAFYSYEGLPTGNIPEEWAEDLWERQN